MMGNNIPPQAVDDRVPFIALSDVALLEIDDTKPDFKRKVIYHKP